MTEALELASIQGFVVRGYRLPSAGYLFLRIDDAARARALLAETTPDVLTADPWETKPESGINMAFTYAGLEALRSELADDADAVWGHCAGYPGRADAPAFAAYFRNHQIESALFFAAYGDQTVDAVRANLAQRTRLIEFAMAAQGLPAAELQARFQAEFPS